MTTTVTMTMPMLTAMMLTKMAMAINYDDDEEKMMAIWYFRGATGPVAVIPLACRRHPSLPLVASDPRVWPGRCSVAGAFSARITPRNLASLWLWS